MSTEIKSAAAFPDKKNAALRWCEFCKQWRHVDLPLAAGFRVLRRASAQPITILGNIDVRENCI
jgi:hypothetical protein